MQNLNYSPMLKGILAAIQMGQTKKKNNWCHSGAQNSGLKLSIIVIYHVAKSLPAISLSVYNTCGSLHIKLLSIVY